MAHNALPPLELSAEGIQQLYTYSAAPKPPKPNYAPFFYFPAGDVRIRVNYKGQEIGGIVLSQIMALASPVWNKFIFPPWIPMGAGAVKEIDLREDDGEAILILLKIVHLQFCNIPAKLSLQTLYHMAQLCEQYECHSCIKPWLKDWMLIQPDKGSSGAWRNVKPEWLYITWAFGYSELFRKVAESILLEGQGNNLHLPDDSRSEKDMEMIVFPEKISEGILAIRQKSFQALVDVVNDTARAFLEKTRLGIVCNQGCADCDQFVYESLYIIHKQLSAWQKEYVTVPRSLMYLSKRISEVQEAFYAEEFYQGDDADHRLCNWHDFQTPKNVILKTQINPVLNCHLRHMERRAAQLAMNDDQGHDASRKRRKISGP